MEGSTRRSSAAAAPVHVLLLLLAAAASAPPLAAAAGARLRSNGPGGGDGVGGAGLIVDEAAGEGEKGSRAKPVFLPVEPAFVKYSCPLGYKREGKYTCFKMTCVGGCYQNDVDKLVQLEQNNFLMMGGRFSRIFGGDEEKRGEATMLTIPYRLGRKKMQMGKSGGGGGGGGANALVGEDAEDPPSPPSIGGGGGGGDKPVLGDTPFLAFVIRFLPEGEETTGKPPKTTEGYPVPTTEKLDDKSVTINLEKCDGIMKNSINTKLCEDLSTSMEIFKCRRIVDQRDVTMLRTVCKMLLSPELRLRDSEGGGALRDRMTKKEKPTPAICNKMDKLNYNLCAVFKGGSVQTGEGHEMKQEREVCDNMVATKDMEAFATVCKMLFSNEDLVTIPPSLTSTHSEKPVEVPSLPTAKEPNPVPTQGVPTPPPTSAKPGGTKAPPGLPTTAKKGDSRRKGGGGLPEDSEMDLTMERSGRFPR